MCHISVIYHRLLWIVQQIVKRDFVVAFCYQTKSFDFFSVLYTCMHIKLRICNSYIVTTNSYYHLSDAV